jgi:hypothetical protein
MAAFMVYAWVLIVAFVILGAAYAVKHASHVLEDEHHFYLLVGGFFILYLGAAVTMSFILPSPGEIVQTPMRDLSEFGLGSLL